jgi:hypothetical protein
VYVSRPIRSRVGVWGLGFRSVRHAPDLLVISNPATMDARLQPSLPAPSFLPPHPFLSFPLLSFFLSVSLPLSPPHCTLTRKTSSVKFEPRKPTPCPKILAGDGKKKKGKKGKKGGKGKKKKVGCDILPWRLTHTHIPPSGLPRPRSPVTRSLCAAT